MYNTIIGAIGGALLMGAVWAYMIGTNQTWCRSYQFRYQMPSGVIVALPPGMPRSATYLCYGTWYDCSHRIEQDVGNFGWVRAPYSDDR